jgi:hypothetical protein
MRFLKTKNIIVKKKSVITFQLIFLQKLLINLNIQKKSNFISNNFLHAHLILQLKKTIKQLFYMLNNI